jgi:murein DD-endopeptidase MepM/ murein hydrolase activator NlpD
MAKAPRRRASIGEAGYPRDGSIATAEAVSARSSRCRSGSAEVRSMSLFKGAITARAVSLSARGAYVSGRIDGLAVRKRRIAPSPGLRLRLGMWGYAITLGYRRGTPTSGASALAVHLVKRHGGLPAGTVLQVAFAVAPAVEETAAPTSAKRPRAHRHATVKHSHRHATVHKRHHHRVRNRHRGEPLKVTPFLGVTGYLFPVAGRADYGDSYGGFRGDVPGNWHHGDDIFAALGTPVVAVADGTLNRVGWERLGGWRLWVRDAMRNEFYYAHLSGYSVLALHSKRIKKGDVIGFIGNTGDAFTTPPHLHFEIHPHQLLPLDYNGAVDPTGYLDGWRHIAVAHAPKPAHPSFPVGVVREEARFVWRRLLAARGLISRAPAPSERPSIHLPRPDTPTNGRHFAARASSVGHASGFPLLAGIAGLFVLAAAFGVTVLLRFRSVPS